MILYTKVFWNILVPSTITLISAYEYNADGEQ